MNIKVLLLLSAQAAGFKPKWSEVASIVAMQLCFINNTHNCFTPSHSCFSFHSPSSSFSSWLAETSNHIQTGAQH